jgi:hypothetical protein
MSAYTPINYSNINATELDYLVKSGLYNVIKTDGFPSDTDYTSVGFERFNVNHIIRADNIWINSSNLLSGPVNNIYANATTVVCIDVNNNSNYKNDPNLYGRAWYTGSSNWVGNLFNPPNATSINKYDVIVCYGQSDLSTSGIHPLDLPTVSGLTYIDPLSGIYPYVFDYGTGVLTFLGTIPTLLTTQNIDSPTSTIYIGGYLYNGDFGLYSPNTPVISSSVTTQNITAQTITAQNIISANITTQNNSINIGSGIIYTADIYLSGNLYSSNGSSFTGNALTSSGLTNSPSITVSTITTQNNVINAGSGKIYGSSFSGNALTASGLINTPSLTVGSIITQNNVINTGSGTIYSSNMYLKGSIYISGTIYGSDGSFSFQQANNISQTFTNIAQNTYISYVNLAYNSINKNTLSFTVTIAGNSLTGYSYIISSNININTNRELFRNTVTVPISTFTLQKSQLSLGINTLSIVANTTGSGPGSILSNSLQFTVVNTPSFTSNSIPSITLSTTVTPAVPIYSYISGIPFYNSNFTITYPSNSLIFSNIYTSIDSSQYTSNILQFSVSNTYTNTNISLATCNYSSLFNTISNPICNIFPVSVNLLQTSSYTTGYILPVNATVYYTPLSQNSTLYSPFLSLGYINTTSTTDYINTASLSSLTNIGGWIMTRISVIANSIISSSSVSIDINSSNVNAFGQYISKDDMFYSPINNTFYQNYSNLITSNYTSTGILIPSISTYPSYVTNQNGTIPNSAPHSYIGFNVSTFNTSLNSFYIKYPAPYGKYIDNIYVQAQLKSTVMQQPTSIIMTNDSNILYTLGIGNSNIYISDPNGTSLGVIQIDSKYALPLGSLIIDNTSTSPDLLGTIYFTCYDISTHTSIIGKFTEKTYQNLTQYGSIQYTQIKSNNISNSDWYKAFNAGVYYNNTLYVGTFWTNTVLAINLNDYTYTLPPYLNLSGNANNIKGITVCNGNIYTLLGNGSIYKNNDTTTPIYNGTGNISYWGLSSDNISILFIGSTQGVYFLNLLLLPLNMQLITMTGTYTNATVQQIVSLYYVKSTSTLYCAGFVVNSIIVLTLSGVLSFGISSQITSPTSTPILSVIVATDNNILYTLGNSSSSIYIINPSGTSLYTHTLQSGYALQSGGLFINNALGTLYFACINTNNSNASTIGVFPNNSYNSSIGYGEPTYYEIKSSLTNNIYINWFNVILAGCYLNNYIYISSTINRSVLKIDTSTSTSTWIYTPYLELTSEIVGIAVCNNDIYTLTQTGTLYKNNNTAPIYTGNGSYSGLTSDNINRLYTLSANGISLFNLSVTPLILQLISMTGTYTNMSTIPFSPLYIPSVYYSNSSIYFIVYKNNNYSIGKLLLYQIPTGIGVSSQLISSVPYSQWYNLVSSDLYNCGNGTFIPNSPTSTFAKINLTNINQNKSGSLNIVLKCSNNETGGAIIPLNIFAITQ